MCSSVDKRSRRVLSEGDALKQPCADGSVLWRSKPEKKVLVFAELDTRLVHPSSEIFPL